MGKQIAVELWERMSDPERILFCKLMTQTAVSLANNSAPNLAEAFLQLAQTWSLVATAVSRESARRVAD